MVRRTGNANGVSTFNLYRVSRVPPFACRTLSFTLARPVRGARGSPVVRGPRCRCGAVVGHSHCSRHCSAHWSVPPSPRRRARRRTRSRSLARDSSRLSSSRLASFASHTGTLISVMMPATPRIACVRLCAMHRLRYARRGFAIGRLAALAFARVWDRLSSRKASRVVAPELGEGVSGGLRSGGAEEAQVELRATREVVDAVARAPRVTVAIVGHQRVPDDALRVPVARRTVGMEPVSLHAHAVWVMWST